MTPQAAAELIEADRQKRSQAAAQLIQMALREQRCELVAAPQINAEGRIVAILRIVAQ